MNKTSVSVDQNHARETARVERIKAAAERARSEAQARRQAAQTPAPEPEHQGREGLEPVRYGDWEVRGLATDF
ncbi:MAG: DUF1674 domain-containing protein [Hyphomicrobiales bacterium]|nr:DUF1674 domain-containing protein [Hyphomicrobiales bacterium]